ncbi:MAG: hypothetical protein ACFCVK_15435 [Acidimicrobiales bacterium]
MTDARSRLIIIAGLLLLCGAGLAIVDRPTRLVMESAAFVSMALLGILIATSEPLGMAPMPGWYEDHWVAE